MNALTSLERETRDRMKDIHSRTRRVPTKREIELEALRAVETKKPRPEPPLWQRRPMEFDYHVETWRRATFLRGAQKYQTYIKDRCTEMGLAYCDVVSGTSRRTLARPRQEIMYGLRTAFSPPPSYTEIGRLFRMDHTTVMHAVQIVAKRMGVEAPVALISIDRLRADESLAAAVRVDFEAGITLDTMSGTHKVSQVAIRQFAIECGWKRPGWVPSRPYTRAPNRKELWFRDLYYSGMPTLKITALTGVPSRSMTTIRQRYGWPLRPRKASND